MATPGQLIAYLAKTLTVPEGKVLVFDRELRRAGLLSRHGRGPSSVHRSPLDAARILIAMLVTPAPRLAVEAVQDFGPLEIIQARPGHPPDPTMTLEKLWPAAVQRHTLEQALAALLAGFGDPAVRKLLADHSPEDWQDHGAILPHAPLMVTVRDTALEAEITVGTTRYLYQHPLFRAAVSVQQATAQAQVGRQPTDTDAVWAAIRAQARLATSVTEALRPLQERWSGIPSARCVSGALLRSVGEFIARPKESA